MHNMGENIPATCMLLKNKIRQVFIYGHIGNVPDRVRITCILMHVCILRISILSTTVGSDLCDPCDPSASSCTSPLVCSSDTNRCECPSGQVQIGDGCCKFEIIKAN